jgi:hypothetical protein
VSLELGKVDGTGNGYGDCAMVRGGNGSEVGYRGDGNLSPISDHEATKHDSSHG